MIFSAFVAVGSGGASGGDVGLYFAFALSVTPSVGSKKVLAIYDMAAIYDRSPLIAK